MNKSLLWINLNHRNQLGNGEDEEDEKVGGKDEEKCKGHVVVVAGVSVLDEVTSVEHQRSLHPSLDHQYHNSRQYLAG